MRALGGSRAASFVLRAGGIAGTLAGVSPVWAADPPANCSHTTSAADGHTCGHGTTGPFATRVGIPYPHLGSAFDIQNVDPTHTLYTVLLSGASTAGEWVVSYQPSVASTYGIYLDLPGKDVLEGEPYEFELRDAFGDPVPIRLEHAITACPGYLAWVKVYELEAARYHLVLGGEANDNVQVAVEHLEAFGQELFIDADRDGYGRSGPGLPSWCGEAEGYSGLDTDCDDEDESVFPDEGGECDLCQGDEPPDSCTSGAGGTSGAPTGSGGKGGASGETGGASSAGGGDPGGASGTGGRGNSQGDGGNDPSEGLAGSSSEDDSDGEDSLVDGVGCSCRVGANPSTGGGGWSALMGIGYLLLRWRRTQSAPDSRAA